MKEALRQLTTLEPLSEQQTFAVIEAMMSSGDSAPTDAQIAAYLFATACRPLSADELVGAASCLRAHMATVSLSAVELLDTCGTGGSGLRTFNTSTASAIVCAAVGQPVAKHGNRASTSASGSADVLEALGVNLSLSPEQCAACIDRTGFGFLFAPQHHAATKRVALLRREVGFRTIFNFLGPLCNPAGAKYQVLGVSAADMTPVIAEALSRLGTSRALVVRGGEGLDELSISAPTDVFEIKGGLIEQSRVEPGDFGLKVSPITALEVQSPEDSAAKMRDVLSGAQSAYRDSTVLNAGAALYISGHADSIAAGCEQAAACLDSGAAAAKLQEIAKVTNELAG